jgi:hypothetical protein
MSRKGFFKNSIYLQYLVFLILCHSNKLNFSGFSLKGIFMIFKMWKKSLEFFKPESLKLFFLVNLNNTKRSVGIILKKFWWIIILAFVPPVIIIPFFLKKAVISPTGQVVSLSFLDSLIVTFSVLVGIIFSALCIYLFYLIVRPSTESKDYRYLKKHLSRIFGFLFIMILAMLSFTFFIYFSISSINYFEMSFFVKIFYLLFVSVFSFAAFFFIDSKKSFKSPFLAIFRAFKLVIHFFPVFLFLNFISFLLMFFISVLFIPVYGFIGSFITLIFIFLSLIISIFNLSLFVNYYTMIRHKHYDLLFG